MAPYASILIPSFDRAETLPIAVRSAQAQTRRDVEIIIVGDGCTPAVRAAAEAFAAADARVRFLDLPKAPLRGAANRDRAVREAKAQRIFYCDDDDILLPHHVETLGAALDEADLVDTPAASVNANGAVSLGLLNSASPHMRTLLLEERFKGVFDTHLAHRKESYLARAGAWTDPPDRRVVLHMLKAFAADPRVRWTTLQRATALSFHGARRAGWSSAERVREMQNYERRASKAYEADLRRDGGFCAHGLSLLHALGAPRPETAETLLTAAGVETAVLTSTQLGALDAAVSVTARRRPPRETAARALAELLEPYLSPFFDVRGVLSRFDAVFSAEELQTMLAQAPPSAAVALARLSLMLDAGKIEQAEANARTALPAMGGERFHFAQAFAAELAARGLTERAWRWSEDMAAVAPHSRWSARFWMLRSSLANQRGRAHEAIAADERLRAIASLDT